MGAQQCLPFGRGGGVFTEGGCYSLSKGTLVLVNNVCGGHSSLLGGNFRGDRWHRNTPNTQYHSWILCFSLYIWSKYRVLVLSQKCTIILKGRVPPFKSPQILTISMLKFAFNYRDTKIRVHQRLCFIPQYSSSDYRDNYYVVRISARSAWGRRFLCAQLLNWLNTSKK